MAYRVSLEVFEGPVELLLYFIHRDKLDVLDVPVAKLADEFVAYVKTMGAELSELADFLLMGSILLRWKVRLLLRESMEEDQEEIEEPVSLSAILSEFARYKETASFLAERRSENLRRYPRGQETEIQGEGEVDKLVESFAALLERERPRQPMVLSREEWTIEDAAAWLETTLTQRKRFSFFEVMRERRAGVWDILILFLAVLEQLRLKRIRVVQPKPFADFLVERTGLQ